MNRSILIGIKQFKELSRRRTFYLKILFHTPISIAIPSFFFLKQYGSTNNEIALILIKLLLWNMVYFSGIETLNILQREINNGTIPIILGSPTSVIQWILISSLIPTLMFLIAIVAYILLVVFYLNSNYNYVNIIEMIALTIPFSISLNVVITATTLYYKKTFNIINTIFDIIYIFVGIYYTTNQLPTSMRLIGRLIPLSYIFNDFMKLDYSRLIYFILGIINFILISAILFRLLLRKVGKDGTVYKY